MIDNIVNNTAEKEAQPFRTNDILKEILDSQPLAWTSYVTFVIVILTFLLSLIGFIIQLKSITK